MKTILDIPRARRLNAYHTAASRVILRRDSTDTYTCWALAAALAGRPLCEVIRNNTCGSAYNVVSREIWEGVFTATEDDVTVGDRLDPEYSSEVYRFERSDALEARIEDIRLMMLALLHAVDQAGDLEDLIQ